MSVVGGYCGWLLWVVVVGGCCGWLLWVVVVGGCCDGLLWVVVMVVFVSMVGVFVEMGRIVLWL